MAISGAASGASTVNPSPINNYNIYFGDNQGFTDDEGLPEVLRCKYWSNPYVNKTSSSYYFPCDNGLKCAFEKEISKNGISCISKSIVNRIFKNSGADHFFLERKEDVFTLICINLEPKDLVNISELSIYCYLATKTNCFWNIQTKKQLNLTCLPRTTCSFTSEQQFQIFFKKMQDRKKPFIAQLNHCKERALELHKAIQITDILYQPRLLEELQSYVGADYNGTLESVDPNSKLGKCFVALASIPREEFNNNQTEFDRIILAHEVARNNASNNTEETQVEDVTDDVSGDTHS